MNTFKLPFGWMPGHWGLKGKTRLRAQAEYELSGMELDLRLAEIDHADDVEKDAVGQAGCATTASHD
jgi:hypothetical protein